MVPRWLLRATSSYFELLRAVYYELGREVWPGAGMGAALARSAVDSAWMISRTTSVQPPQHAPAPHACATSRAVMAPPRTALRMVRSEIPLQ